MQPTDLVAAAQSHLNSVLPVPVQVSGDDERPVPSVLISGWDIENIQRHNTRGISAEFDNTGTETARWYAIPYDCRINFTVRHDEAVDASRLHDTLREELLKLEINPSVLSDEVGRVETGGGNAISYQYASPTEAEATQDAVFTSEQYHKRTDFDTLDLIDWVVEVVDN